MMRHQTQTSEVPMSTRALYTFRDADGEYHVYKHHDGYPDEHGGFATIGAAKRLAWDLPRFEADEFAAAFVAAAKDGPGGVRLLHSGKWQDVAPGDIAYRYEITCVDGKLNVTAWSVSNDWDTGKWSQRKVSARS